MYEKKEKTILGEREKKERRKKRLERNINKKKKRRKKRKLTFVRKIEFKTRASKTWIQDLLDDDDDDDYYFNLKG